MKLVTHMRKHKFLFLLASLLAFFALNPFFYGDRMSRYIFGLLFTLIIITSVYTIQRNRRILIAAAILATLAFSGHWLIRFVPYKQLIIFDYVVTIAFFALITTDILLYVIRKTRVTSNALYGSMCGYLLIGFTWSFVHLLIFTLNPHAYNIPIHEVKTTDLMSINFIYYSFTTITTLGYGDIIPISNIAKTAAWLEAIMGQFYMTIWIAQLVGLHIVFKLRQLESKDKAKEEKEKNKS